MRRIRLDNFACEAMLARLVFGMLLRMPPRSWAVQRKRVLRREGTVIEAAQKAVLGWREWVGLPALGIGRIKAKVDTGARTSTLHAFAVEPFEEAGRQRVRFSLHPAQHDLETVLECVADVLDRRIVSDSGGHREKRYVIRTEVEVGAERWPIEMTLTARDDMMFRMLLGRTAIKGRYVVDPARSYVAGKRLKRARLK